MRLKFTLAAAALCCLTSTGFSEEKTNTTWDAIYMAGQRIGYAKSTTETIKGKGDESIIRSTTETNMSIKRFGQDLKIQSTHITDANPQGDVLRFKYTMRNPPANDTVNEGVVQGEKALLKITIGGDVSEKQIAWDSDVKSASYQDELFKKEKLTPGKVITFKTYLPDFNRITDVKLEVGEMEQVTLAGDKKAELRKVVITQAAVPGIKTNAYIDKNGDALKTETLVVGTSMVTYRVDQKEALKAVSGKEIDLAVKTLVKVRDIASAHRAKAITYKVAVPGVDLEELLPNGGTQQVKKLNNDTVELTVTSFGIPQAAKSGSAEPEFLKATRFLQCEDDAILKHVKAAAGDETDAAKIALAMEKYVYKTLSKKNFSTALASAGEVARNLEGDCTEHAVLLAAMLRAKEIPSRIVVGMVYVRSLSAFGGHMWCEAKLGDQWIPLDATLGRWWYWGWAH